MAELTREQIAAASERGRIVREIQPHARSARYDAKADRVVIDLTKTARTFAFPPRRVEGLHDASLAEIDVEVIGAGFGLHWETLEPRLYRAGPRQRRVRTTKWMAGRAGRTTSPAKAARANGRKGGRPRRAG